jgi:ABC-type sugar transport system ATPase subunit
VLRILAGLEEPTAGRVFVGGHDFTGVETHQRGLALITQENQLLGKRTAAGNIRFPLDVGDPRNRPDNRDELVEFEASHLCISHLLDRNRRHSRKVNVGLCSSPVASSAAPRRS